MKRDFGGEDVVGVASEDCCAAVVPPKEGKAGLGVESAPLVPILKSEDAPVLEGAGVEKSDLVAPSAVLAGVSFALSLVAFENKPPPLDGAGRRNPDALENKPAADEPWVVVVGAVAEEVVFKLKRPRLFPDVPPCGGGPAGVVDARLNPVPEEAGVAAAVFPKIPPPVFPAFPKRPLV